MLTEATNKNLDKDKEYRVRQNLQKNLYIESTLGSDGSGLGDIVVVSCQVPEFKGMVSNFLLTLSCRSSAAMASLSGRSGWLFYAYT